MFSLGRSRSRNFFCVGQTFCGKAQDKNLRASYNFVNLLDARLAWGRLWRYRLGVRTEDSQSSNPGSIPGSATNYHPLSRVISAAFLFVPKWC